MKFKREGQAVGHGIGKIQARTIGKRRRLCGVTLQPVQGVSGRLERRLAYVEMLRAKARAAKRARA